MIVYNLNYLKWFYKNNFMNVKINVFEKHEMEIASFPFLSHIEAKSSLNIETNKWEYYTL
jgi:hypothetical protein